ncbi:MAG: patatin-like phospholipase family protein [Pseudomonadota bacterium]
MTDWAASEEKGLLDTVERYDRKAIGLSLSGGGYRATLFHTGVLLRLNELGILSRIARISSVSGGSITAGVLAMNWDQLGLTEPGSVASDEAMRTALVEPVLRVTGKTLDVPGILAGFIPWVSAGNVLARLYDRVLFGGMKLADITSRPKFIFNATNLQTGGVFRFTKHYLSDPRALYCEDHGVSIAEAVAASSAFPPVLSPMRLDLRGRPVQKSKWAEPPFDQWELRRRPVLVDGGVYDNLGLESIWKHCGVLIASYSGFYNDPRPHNFNLLHFPAVIDTFLASSIDWRERLLINLFENQLSDGLPERIGTYWTAETTITDYDRHTPWQADDPIFAAALASPTRLRGLDREGQVPVIQAGYAFADAGVRTRLLPDAPAPNGPPDL